ncbi:hypothetical protein [Nocardia yamanashiensis]|uniref:hypothetical protein n=1 Tax=Nocardia yamanashiensis TaxID=209247 RepID=UPI0012FDC601|nr:hypothetical protein [Nocardia yamanashiensis]
MIPKYSINVDPSLPTSAIYELPGDEDISDEGFGYFRETWRVSDDREDAIRVIANEVEALRWIDRKSRSGAEFERMARAIEADDKDLLLDNFGAEFHDNEISDLFEEDDFSILEGLELGVAGLSHALNSIGCVTAASCRGHISKNSWSPYPVVFFATTRDVADCLVPMVRDSGCGFDDASDRGNLIAIDAPSIANTINLAQLIVSRAKV